MQNILYRSDCKEALERLIDDGVRVDLIYLDPPFNSSRFYNMIYSRGKGKAATQKAFHDMWSLTSQNYQMVLQFETILDDIPDISQLVKDFLKAWIAPLKNGTIEDQKMVVYLIYMTQRLSLMRRVLKPTGSIYFHCDPTASHYIKIIMDGIFGRENFRNEIIWKRRTNTIKAISNKFSTNTDTILFYTKLKNNYFFNIPYQEYEKEYLARFRYEDENGKYRWQVMATYSEKRLEDLKKDGKIKISDTAKYPQFKQYLHDLKGRPIENIWSDIDSINAMAKERLGYPTQKPLALLDRIIKASCPDDGIILDPFCGCVVRRSYQLFRTTRNG